ncbi:MAG: TetR/AcrR family transcriptional regulator C-terminal ligand-binding domain-containing protein [Sphingomicrobium sp.]
MSTPARTISRRPGGRTADVTARIQQAVGDILIDGGTDACTFKAVAERAGIERSTLYRRFPDRWDMIIDFFMARAATDVMPDLGKTFAEDLTCVLRRLVSVLESPVGPALLGTAAALRANAGSDYSRAFFDRRMEQLEPMFKAAIARGELRSSVDRELIFTSAAGPIYFRIFIAGRGADDDFIRSVVSDVCWLYCSPSVAAKISGPTRLT